jgi:hypothetical protein
VGIKKKFLQEIGGEQIAQDRMSQVLEEGLQGEPNQLLELQRALLEVKYEEEKAGF